jgi:hypothetical protein
MVLLLQQSQCATLVKFFHPKNERLNANVKIVNICFQNSFFCIEVWLMMVHKIFKQKNELSDLRHGTATSAGNNFLSKKEREIS